MVVLVFPLQPVRGQMQIADNSGPVVLFQRPFCHTVLVLVIVLVLDFCLFSRNENEDDEENDWQPERGDLIFASAHGGTWS
jgi:hypothetical protein